MKKNIVDLEEDTLDSSDKMTDDKANAVTDELVEEVIDNAEDEVSSEVEVEDDTNSDSDIADNVQDNTNDKLKTEVIEKKDSSAENKLVNSKKKYEVVNISKKSFKTIIGVSIAFIVIVIIFLIFSTIFALTTSYNSNIINGVSIKDIDVSGLTKEQALEKLSVAFNEKLAQEITLFHNDYEIEVFANQFGVSFDLDGAVNMAYSKGRTGNIFQNNYEILASMTSGIKINPGFSFSDESLTSLVTEMETNFSDRLVEPSYYVEGNNLIITKGKDGIVINSGKLKNEIIYVINNLDRDINRIDIPVDSKIASTLDLNKVHEEIYRAPKDAYYTTNPYVVYPHSDGIDFAISMEEAQNAFIASQDSCTIPLKVLIPAVTTNQIGTEAFPDLLGSFSTTFATSNVNRSTNIRLAGAKINGTVVMPGETFSYNQTVGKRTAAAGFKAAAVYAGGEVTTGIGGGICQVSSTLYNSVLLSNLEIVERYNHGFNPGYVPAGRDATVSWGGPDLKFKNNRNYPVRVVCTVKGGTISVQIFGLKTDNDYNVEIQSYITSYIQYKTIERKDATLAKGTTKVIQSGSNGCRSVCYRILKKNGEVISKTLLSTDTYSPHNKIVAVGTKQ